MSNKLTISEYDRMCGEGSNVAADIRLPGFRHLSVVELSDLFYVKVEEVIRALR